MNQLIKLNITNKIRKNCFIYYLVSQKNITYISSFTAFSRHVKIPVPMNYADAETHLQLYSSDIAQFPCFPFCMEVDYQDHYVICAILKLPSMQFFNCDS